MVKAAVLHNINQTLEIQDLTLEDPRPDEVRVKIHTTGVCHSDLSALRGKYTIRPPCVLGHEGAGEIVAVGSDVTDKKVGDHVILSFCMSCGNCRYCQTHRAALCIDPNNITRMSEGTRVDGTAPHSINGEKITPFMALGTFAEETVVNHKQAIVVDPELPLVATSLIGCGVSTGLGAVMNTAQVKPGSSVAVIGCGGVGLNVIQGAKIAGAKKIIAIDIIDEKLQFAKDFGATDVVNGTDVNPVKAVKALTHQLGVDYAFEVLGSQQTFLTALSCTGPNGAVVLVGVPSLQDSYSFPFAEIIMDKKIMGCLYGSIDPATDFKKYLGFYREGKLKLDELVTREYPLEKINEVFEDMQAGKLARGIIRF